MRPIEDLSCIENNKIIKIYFENQTGRFYKTNGSHLTEIASNIKYDCFPNSSLINTLKRTHNNNMPIGWIYIS